MRLIPHGGRAFQDRSRSKFPESQSLLQPDVKRDVRALPFVPILESKMKRSGHIYLYCYLLMLVGTANIGALTRQANNTINMPQDPQPSAQSYVIKEALNGLEFDKPVGFAVEPGEANRLFVVERTGRIILITDLANPSRTVFMDITNKVYSEYQ